MPTTIRHAARRARLLPRAGLLRAAAVLLAALVTASGVAATHTEPARATAAPGTLTETACPFDAEVDYDPARTRCLFLAVPENRERESRTIRLLAVHVRAARATERRPDPVVYLTGGPGVHVEPYVEGLARHGVAEFRDLYILEQRGVGRSDFCPQYGKDRDPGREGRTSAERDRQAIADFEACARAASTAGVDLSGYSTIESARDVRALREALGLREWNVWGVSYGSMLGQAVLRVDPEGVKAIALDAIVPLDLTGVARFGHWFAALVARFDRECAAQARCAAAFPNLAARLLAAAESLRTDPLEISRAGRTAQRDDTITFNETLATRVPIALAYDTRNHAAFPAAVNGLLRMIEARDVERLRALDHLLQQSGPPSSPGIGGVLRCLDGYYPVAMRDVADDRVATPGWGPLMGSPEYLRDAQAACLRAGLPPRPRDDYVPVRSDRAALIANGEWDPATPSALASSVLQGLRHAHWLPFPHEGHAPTRSAPCTGEMLTAFFDQPVRQPRATCAAGQTEQAIYAGALFETRAAPRALLAWAHERHLALAHIAWVAITSALSIASFFGWIAYAALSARRPDQRLDAPDLTLAIGTATLSVTYLGLSGLALQATLTVSPYLLLFGLVSWASWVAWLAPMLGLLGLSLAVRWGLAWKTSRAARRAASIGALTTGVAAASLSAIAWRWDLWPAP